MPFFFFSLKYMPVSKANLIFNIHPLMVTVIAYFVLKENLTQLRVFALIGAFMGVVILSIHKNDNPDDNESGNMYYIAIFMISVTC